jgi:hypothetical protein
MATPPDASGHTCNALEFELMEEKSLKGKLRGMKIGKKEKKNNKKLD